MKPKNVLLSVLFLFTSFCLCQPVVHQNSTLEVHYLNVGQADAIVIECPTKEHTLLIDAGDTRYPGSAKNFKKSLQEIFGNRTKKIDVVIASHPHADHIGSMKWVLENFDVVKYVDNGQVNETALYDNLMDLIQQQVESNNLEYQPAEVADDTFVDFCPENNVNSALVIANGHFDDCDNPNDCSVVVRVDYDKTSFLFPGDAEKELEAKLLKDVTAKKRLNVDVLKGGHHGSNTSSSLPFMKAVTPKIIVVSVGAKNVGTNVGYKHPQGASIQNYNAVLPVTKMRKEKIDVYDKAKKKWAKKGIKEGIWLTVLDGDVVIASDGKRVWKK